MPNLGGKRTIAPHTKRDTRNHPKGPYLLGHPVPGVLPRLCRGQKEPGATRRTSSKLMDSNENIVEAMSSWVLTLKRMYRKKTSDRQRPAF